MWLKVGIKVWREILELVNKRRYPTFLINSEQIQLIVLTILYSFHYEYQENDKMNPRQIDIFWRPRRYATLPKTPGNNCPPPFLQDFPSNLRGDVPFFPREGE